MMDNEMHVGFTGTRHGMTKPQKKEVLDLFTGHHWLHHGKCIGADAEAHELAKSLRMRIALHPPTVQSLIAACEGDIEFPPAPYLKRNRAIVDAVSCVIAAPFSAHEEVRSGTWATIRYARKVNKKLFIILPDGSYRVEYTR